MDILKEQFKKPFSLDKVKSYFNETISSYRLEISCLLLLILIGFFIRSYNTFWGPSIIPLSGDDFYHIFTWSGIDGLREDLSSKNIFKPLSRVFMFSYDDAHPPLRNIVINIILHFTRDLNSARLVSLIPGLILIPLTFFLALSIDQHTSKKNATLVGLLLAFLITFSEIFIQLSFETRPYMMSLMFIFLATLSTIKFSKTLSANYLLIFSITACLALLTNYPSLSTIAVCCFSILVITFKNFKSLSKNLKIYIFIALSTIILLTAFQAHYLQKQSSFNRYSGQAIKEKTYDYISSYYIKDYKEIPEKVINYFLFFSTSKSKAINTIASIILFIAYILGLIILARKKSFLLLSISTFPLMLAVIASMMYLYPLGPTRHCSEFLLSVLIPWTTLLLFLFERISPLNKNISAIIISVLLLLITNPNLEKDYVWPIGGIYGYHKIPEKNLIDFLYKLNELKESNKLIIFDELSYEIVKQKMIILWTELKLNGKDLNFPESILSNDTNQKFFFCSNINIENKKEFCKEEGLLDKLKTNNRSVVVISWNKFGDYAHKKVVEAIKDNSRYTKEASKPVIFEEQWSITELNF